MTRPFFRDAVILSPAYTPDNSPEGIAKRRELSNKVTTGLNVHLVSIGKKVPTIEDLLYTPDIRSDIQSSINGYYADHTIKGESETPIYKLPADQLHQLQYGFTFWQTKDFEPYPGRATVEAFVCELRKKVGALKLNEYENYFCTYGASISQADNSNFKLIQSPAIVVPPSTDLIFFDVYVRYKIPK